MSNLNKMSEKIEELIKELADKAKRNAAEIKKHGGGFYNAIFGINPVASIILAMLDLDVEKIGRFRDAFICGDKIAIYTRLGANNAECCCEEEDIKKHPHPLDSNHANYCFVPNIRYLQNHPQYLSDEEDKFDPTYRTFYFKVPERYKEIAKKMDSGNVNPDERWEQTIKALNDWIEVLKHIYRNIYSKNV